MIAGRDLPDEPKPTWNIANLASVQEVLAKKDVNLEVDESGPTPVCHIRLGSLLPGEQGRSELLAILPQAESPRVLWRPFRLSQAAMA